MVLPARSSWPLGPVLSPPGISTTSLMFFMCSTQDHRVHLQQQGRPGIQFPNLKVVSFWHCYSRKINTYSPRVAFRSQQPCHVCPGCFWVRGARSIPYEMLGSGWEMKKGGLHQGLRHDYCDWLESCRTATLLSVCPYQTIHWRTCGLLEVLITYNNPCEAGVLASGLAVRITR